MTFIDLHATTDLTWFDELPTCTRIGKKTFTICQISVT